jgi:UDP-glucuronate decarboxylase
MLENDGRVVSNFIVQALRNEPLTIYGTGSQTRSFCFIEDLLGGLELLMAADDNMIEPCNLGNPREVTVIEIAKLITELAGSSSPLAFRPLPQDDPKRRRPVIDKAAKLLGWQPRVSLEAGLRATIGYFALKIFAPDSSSTPAARAAAPTRKVFASANKHDPLIALASSRP